MLKAAATGLCCPCGIGHTSRTASEQRAGTATSTEASTSFLRKSSVARLCTHPATALLPRPNLGGYGNHVYVDCGEGQETLYAHLSRIDVEAGEQVGNETVLGVSGNTGFSTSEHLHFEIISNGMRVNPEHYLDFDIPEGAPLSNGPLFWSTATNTATATPTPTDTPTITPTPTLPPTQVPYYQ